MVNGMRHWKLFLVGGLLALGLWVALSILEIESPTWSYLPGGLLILYFGIGVLLMALAGAGFFYRLIRKKSADSPSAVPTLLIAGATLIVVFIACVGLSGQLWRIQFYRWKPELRQVAERVESPDFVLPRENGQILANGPRLTFDPGPPIRFLALFPGSLNDVGYVFDPSDKLLSLLREPETQGMAGAPGTRTSLLFGYTLIGCDRIEPKWYRCTVDLD